MPSIFGSSSGDGGARKMKKAFDDELKELLCQVDVLGKDMWGKPEFPEDKEPLDIVKIWSSRIYASKKRLEEKLSSKESRVEDLEQDLVITKSNLSKAKEDHQNFQRKVERDMDRTKEEHKQQLSTANENHVREQNRMKGQLLVNQSDDDGWPDDKLKHTYQELHRLITNLVNSREFTIPSKKKFDAAWDNTNFISRAGKRNINFLLHSAIWNILYKQFFSEPFGFGAFGPGNAQAEIHGLYASWLKVVTKDGMKSSKSSGSDKYAIFRRSRLANNWRAATFQSIYESLDSKSSSVSKLLSANVDETINRIMAILVDVSVATGKAVPADIEIQVRRIVDLVRELALQFGLHSAQLKLLYPDHGDGIRIGEEYHDCVDDDMSMGETFSVDLVTLPGFQRVGDGRSDMESKRTLVPCDIFPRSGS